MAKTAKTNRFKLGYLNYNEISARIECGDLTVFDVVYTKDTHEAILITPEYSLLSIKSKVYCYPDVTTAENALNEATDTYEGQIVSIISNEVYVGYIVNRDYNGRFFVTPLCEMGGSVDYNALANKPVTNLVGTYEEPILIETLDNGIYSIKGQYCISEQIETIYLSATNILFLVEKIEDKTHIKKITSAEIIDYVISAEGIEISSMATTAYIESCGFATTTYVDNKLAALNFITQEEVDTYVKELVQSSIDEILDERIDAKLDERLQEAEDDSVMELFQ